MPHGRPLAGTSRGSTNLVRRARTVCFEATDEGRVRRRRQLSPRWLRAPASSESSERPTSTNLPLAVRNRLQGRLERFPFDGNHRRRSDPSDNILDERRGSTTRWPFFWRFPLWSCLRAVSDLAMTNNVIASPVEIAPWSSSARARSPSASSMRLVDGCSASKRWMQRVVERRSDRRKVARAASRILHG